MTSAIETHLLAELTFPSTSIATTTSTAVLTTHTISVYHQADRQAAKEPRSVSDALQSALGVILAARSAFQQLFAAHTASDPPRFALLGTALALRDLAKKAPDAHSDL
jgi:hypothetical protein